MTISMTRDDLLEKLAEVLKEAQDALPKITANTKRRKSTRQAVSRQGSKIQTALGLRHRDGQELRRFSGTDLRPVPLFRNEFRH
jgi:hypothetical protein